jgi:DDE superfamily endonuclease
MLPRATIPRSLRSLLEEFRPCFTAPTFATFCGLVTGLIAQTRRRTVCGMLLGAGLERAWHHARAHRFFAAARWSPDRVGLILCDQIIKLLLAADAPITLAVDDTLFKRAGKKVHGAFWHHDGAAKGPKPVGYGNCWVVTGIVVELPFLCRPVCLPVLARLWFPKGTGKIAHARAMVERIATRYPDRTVHVVGDAAYISEHLRELGGNITWTSRLKVTSVLHQAPPPRTGKVGRPRTKGLRLGTPGNLAKAATWRNAMVRRYGRTDTVETTELLCIWYGVLHTQLVRVILERDDKPRTKDKDERGYGLALITTDLTSTAEQLIARYASRWSIEPVFFNARRILGIGEARNRLRNAVQRTVPFGLIAYSLTVLWYTRHGHDPAQITEQRTRQRWYTNKTEPSFEDMVIKLRRVIIAARFQHPGVYQPQPEETRAILLAWAAADT